MSADRTMLGRVQYYPDTGCASWFITKDYGIVDMYSGITTGIAAAVRVIDRITYPNTIPISVLTVGF